MAIGWMAPASSWFGPLRGSKLGPGPWEIKVCEAEKREDAIVRLPQMVKNFMIRILYDQINSRQRHSFRVKRAEKRDGPLINKRALIAFFILVFFGIATVFSLLFFSDGIAVLSPAGMISEKQTRLLWIATVVMLFVVVPVFLLTFFIAWKYRASNQKAKYSPEWDRNHTAEIIWWGIPCVIIVILGVFTWIGCHELDPFKPIESNVKPVKIQVVALQWKWLFIYPEQNIASVNYFEIPVDTPIDFEITSDAPMNSFWLPKLGGQVYAMSGMRSKLHLMAYHEGSYPGSSANISGAGFSSMVFTAKATSREAFDSWVASVQSSSQVLGSVEYADLAKPSSYVPPDFYRLGEPGLFDSIIMKYMMPMPHKEDHAQLSRD